MYFLHKSWIIQISNSPQLSLNASQTQFEYSLKMNCLTKGQLSVEKDLPIWFWTSPSLLQQVQLIVQCSLNLHSVKRAILFSATCQSIQQRIHDGENHVGGEPSTAGEERRKGNLSGSHRQRLLLCSAIRMLYHREHRMPLTGVNEKPGWLPRLLVFPSHTSLFITQLHFLKTCRRQFPKSYALLGAAAVPFDLRVYEKTGKSGVCFVAPASQSKCLPCCWACEVRG